jgi:HEAT repeat protein
VAGVAVLKASANALVVARFEAGALPWLYVAAAVLTGLFAFGDGALRKSTAAPRGSLVFAAALTAALGLAARFGAAWAVAALYVFSEAYATVTSVRFWAALGDSFDARESKRLFGVIGGFGMAGSVLGGLLGSLGALVGAIPVLGFSALSMIGCALLGARIGKRPASAPPRIRGISTLEMAAVAEPLKRAIYQGGEALRFVRADRYSRGLASLAALAAVLTVLADYLFRISARGALDEDALAAFFGSINVVLGLLAAGFQIFGASRFLGRFGIFRYLAIAPASTLGLGLLCAAFPALAPAFALKVMEGLGSLSIQPTGMQLLYGPLPDRNRVPIRALVDGLVKKGGAAFGGLLLLVLGLRLGKVGLALAVAAVSLALVGLLSLLKRLYVSTIDARLTRARWDEGVAMDAEARSILLRSLEDEDPARALLAADLLAAERSPNFSPWVRVLLAHPSDRVRVRGVQLAAELGLVELVPRLRAVVEKDVRRPRDEAVIALGALDPQAPQLLAPLVGSEDPGLRCAAIAALLRREPDAPDDSPAVRVLERMLVAHASLLAERRELARLLGRLHGTRWAARLDPLLSDPDPSVRRIALASASECGRVDLAPRMLEMLAEREVRRAAREALASMGDRIAPLLEDALNDKSRPAAVRYEIPRLLRYLGTPRAAQILLFSNIDDDPFLRYRIALALSRMRRDNVALPFDPERTRAAVLRQVEAYLYYLPIYRDLQQALGQEAILVRAICDRLDQSLEIVFRLLGLLLPPRTILNVLNRYAGGEARERAYALELFENLVDESMRERVLPVLERYHRLPADGAGQVERAPARLLELTVSKDAVLRGCAICTLRREIPEAAALRIVEEGTVSENVMQKVFLLEGVAIFEHCSVDDLAALAAIAHERRFARGTLVYRENDPGDALFVIIEGRVRSEKDGRTIMEVKEKEAFGDISLLDGAPRPASALALTDTRVLAIDRQDFLDLISDRPELLKGLFGALTRQLRQVLEMAASGRPGAGLPGAAERKASGG